MAHEEVSVGRLTAIMAGFFLVGAPMIGVIWHTLSELLAGRFHARALLASLLLLTLFLIFARFLARFVGQVTGSK